MENNKDKTKKGVTTMKGKYLNPKADLTFKLIFGEHPDLTKSLLNALLPLDKDAQITSLEYATPEMVPENPAKKNSVFPTIPPGSDKYLRSLDMNLLSPRSCFSFRH